MTPVREFTDADAARQIAVPQAGDDKYSRGVLGVITGSDRYPGAAVLGVEAALRTGLGMVRYLGPGRAADLVLQRRPEVVTADGRVQAWLLGSGTDAASEIEGAEGAAGANPVIAARLRGALASGHPLIIDAGALDRLADAVGPTVITPHAGELARLIGLDVAEVRAQPVVAARAAAERFGCTVLIKGFETHVVGIEGHALLARTAPTWLATAGAGDALAGILAALVTTHADEVLADPRLLSPLAAAAAVIHGLAAQRASAGGPLTVLDLCREVSPAIAQLVAQHAA